MDTTFYKPVFRTFKPLVPAVIAFLCACAPQASSDWSVKVGDPVPAFDLTNVNGEKVSSDGLQGKPFVVSIFATWCPPCKMEMQALEKTVWQPLKDKGISVVAVNYGDESEQTISEFVRSNGFTFPVLVDEAGKFRQESGVTMVPQSLVIGTDGKIIDLHVGYTDESVAKIAEQLQDAL